MFFGVFKYTYMYMYVYVYVYVYAYVKKDYNSLDIMVKLKIKKNMQAYISTYPHTCINICILNRHGTVN